MKKEYEMNNPPYEFERDKNNTKGSDLSNVKFTNDRPSLDK